MKRRSTSGYGLLMAAVAALTGCAGQGGERTQGSGEAAGTAEAWSTRDESILGKVAPERSFQVEPVDPTFAAGLRGPALDVLQQAVDSESALLRANAIEALHCGPREAVEAAVSKGLADENRGVRFVAAMTVGRLRLENLAFLLEPLLHDPSESVRAAAMYGLRANGLEVDLTPLAAYLSRPDPEVRANAALVLGEIGDASALPLLRSAMGRPMTRVAAERARLVDMQIAEAMVKLGEESQIEGIRAGLFAPSTQGEVVALACQMAGRLEDGRVARNLVDLATRSGPAQPSAEVRLAATAALGTINPDMAPMEVPLGYAGSDLFAVRAQAALTLGSLRRPAGLNALAVLLNDDNPIVQVSAAAGILRIVPAEAVTEVR